MLVRLKEWNESLGGNQASKRYSIQRKSKAQSSISCKKSFSSPDIKLKRHKIERKRKDLRLRTLDWESRSERVSKK